MKTGVVEYWSFAIADFRLRSEKKGKMNIEHSPC